MNNRSYASPLQRSYADVLRSLALVGYGLLIVFYGIYLMGIVALQVEPEVTAQHWHLPADEYVETTEIHPGTGWMAVLRYGEGLSLASLAFLALVSIPCLIRILPQLIRNRDWVYAFLVTLEIAILSLAASGLLKGGH
jgi:hypothetical protein